MKKIIILFILFIISIFPIYFYFKNEKINSILKNIEKENFMFFITSASPKDENILNNKPDLKFIFKEALKNEKILKFLEEKSKENKNPELKYFIEYIKYFRNKKIWKKFF